MSADGHDGADLANHAKGQRAKRIPNPKGGKSALTPQVEQTILAAIRENGMSLRTACAVAGISEVTLWRRRKSDAALAARVENARELFKASMLRVITTAAPTKWGAAAWMLERMFPEEFGRRGVEREHRDSVKVVIEGGRRENDHRETP